MKVKVGDKVKIVSVGGGHAGYETGETLEVIALNVRNPKDIYVRISKDVGYTGKGSDRPIEQPFAFLVESEYEVVESEGLMFGIGDKVKLIDRFYEHEAFKSDKRYIRKPIANLAGKEFKVTAILFGRAHTTADIMYTIPVELLEKVDGLTKAPKPGDLFKVINKGNNYHHFELGEIVEFIKDETSMGMYLLRGYSKSRNEVCNQVLCVSDIEPYTKHRYTAEQIAEARKIVYEEMTSIQTIRAILLRRFPFTGCFSRDVDGRYMDKPHTLAMFLEYKGFAEKKFEKGNHAVAVCLPTDEWNDDIGNMVAVCKLTGRKLPDWL